MEIGKNKIRNIFYFGMITIVIILLVVSSGIFISAFNAQTETKIAQLSAGIYDMKKIYAKDVIDRTIQAIDIERECIITSETERMTRLENEIAAMALDNVSSTQLYAYLINFEAIFPGIKMLIYD
ncbi:hypothetical protein KHM83_17330 [Fusibacter paucivorans]|uniref:Four helix bundle sensory module for signal transduction n=1 Tax=Fusibacter paucivorans TaxID=76009 RepID=A0ABS5PW24_9FIRM|nr:hypothetical protein [Fusibacter paucivorans]MBS7528452.1 hypothetical protein [Fusibacter paucivorans]